MTTPNEPKWTRRNYRVCVGMQVSGAFVDHKDAVTITTIDGAELVVIPFRDVRPITLSYPPDKAKRVTPDCEFAEVEACERVIKMWKKDHPEDEDMDLVAWDPVCFKQTLIDNTLV